MTGADGVIAEVTLPFPPFLPWSDSSGDSLVEAARAHLAADRRVAVLLVRRGGYACAVVEGGAVVASKVGSRHVQGRTAAGGWSQQRFARRRENQASELADAAVQTAARLLLADPGPGWLVTGGDKPLLDRVLSDPRLRSLSMLPRGPHLAIGDPRADTVRGLPTALRAVRIMLSDRRTPVLDHDE